MPPTPQKPAAPRGKSGGDKPAKPTGGKLMDSLLTEVRKSYKGKKVEYRTGPLNAKGERLLRVDGDTVAYVSVLENGELRALRSKYGLSSKGDVKSVAKAIVAAVKKGAATATVTRRQAPAASGASGTTRQRQAASRRQAKTTGAKTPAQHLKQPSGPSSSTPKANDKPKANGNDRPKTNGGNAAPSGK